MYSRLRRMIRVVLFSTLLIAGGCISSSSTGSQTLTPENISKIVKGTTTRNEVVALLGDGKLLGNVEAGIGVPATGRPI